MRYQYMNDPVEQFQIGIISRVLRVSRSGYYSWLNRPESERARENEKLLESIKAIHKKSRCTYGSPRVHRQLAKDGEVCGKGRVARLMRRAEIRAKQKRKFRVTTDSKHNFPVAENRLNRQFAVSAPNTVWTADITYIPTRKGWLYLSAAMDLCSKGIAEWSMAERMEKGLMKDALRMAQARRNPARGLLHHSDHGSQYASADYQKSLKDYGMQVSMSRKGDC
jgi:transposase InsO family protein